MGLHRGVAALVRRSSGRLPRAAAAVRGAATGVLKARGGVIYEVGIADRRLASGSRARQLQFMSGFRL
jgi:hypothetical protein